MSSKRPPLPPKDQRIKDIETQLKQHNQILKLLYNQTQYILKKLEPEPKKTRIGTSRFFIVHKNSLHNF